MAKAFVVHTRGMSRVDPSTGKLVIHNKGDLIADAEGVAQIERSAHHRRRVHVITVPDQAPPGEPAALTRPAPAPEPEAEPGPAVEPEQPKEAASA